MSSVTLCLIIFLWGGGRFYLIATDLHGNDGSVEDRLGQFVEERAKLRATRPLTLREVGGRTFNTRLRIFGDKCFLL